MNQLVIETALDLRGKDIGENVLFQDLPDDVQCYALYYPGAMPDPEIEDALRTLGRQTGRNLFVNIGRLDDPNYGKITNLFKIEKTPAIIVTAIASLAAPRDEYLSAFARIDSSRLLAKPDETARCIHEVSTLFLSGKVPEAIARGKWTERKELLGVAASFFKRALEGLWKFVDERDVSVSIAEGRFELKKSVG